jgi:hypothetical protein
MEKGSAIVGRDFGKRLRKLDDEFDHALYRVDELVSKPLPLLITLLGRKTKDLRQQSC